MTISRYRKVFGVGPAGAAITLALLLVAWWADRALGHPVITNHRIGMIVIGTVLALTGAALHVCTFVTLRRWWSDSQLCTGGPFRWFRHPMYAAWVTFIILGICLLLNSWVFLISYIVLHPIWHRLVVKEERLMEEKFGDVYINYKARTGRFIPKF